MKQNFKRIFGILLTFTMLMSISAPCFAAENSTAGSGINVSITFSDNSDGSIIYYNENLSLESGLSGEYGYTETTSNEISVFDALIAVHKAVLGDEFTKDTAKNYLDISGGWINKVFADSSAPFGFMVNDRTPNDGVYNESYGSYTAYTADQAYLSDGDRISFFFYGDRSYWSDLYAMLNEESKDCESVTLKLSGFMTFFGAYPEESIAEEPIEGIELTISRDGINFEDSGIKTDENGAAKVPLADSDYYYISAKSDTENGVFISSPVIKVKKASDNNAYTSETKDTLLKNISNSYTDTTDFWTALDMAAYGDSDKLTQKSEIEKLIKETAEKEDASISELSKAVLAANSIGLNAEKIQTDSKGTVNLADRISQLDVNSLGYVTNSIVALYAYDSNNYNVTGSLDRAALLQNMLDSRAANGLYGYSWGGVDCNDIDSSAMAVTAFAKYYLAESAADVGIDETLYNEIKSGVDTIVDGLSNLQGENASYGNANTDAMVVIALHSLGIDPLSDSRFIKGSSNLENALLSYKTDDLSGFKYLSTDGSLNAMATEQAFRALVSGKNFSDGSKKPYNIYSTVVQSSSGNNNPSSGSGSSSGGSSSSGGGSSSTTPIKSTIDVYLTITGDYVHGEEEHKGVYPTWESKTKLTIAENSTVQDLISAFAENSGYKFEGLSTGYISSVTNPDGVTIGEFTNGQNSGWLYKVNGSKPSVGITSYTLKNSDLVEFYYTDDYTLDKTSVSSGSSGGSGGSGGSANDTQASQTPSPSEITANTENIAEITFIDVPAAFWAVSHIKKLSELGIINGYEDNSFKPDNQISRAEFTAILARISGDELVNEELSFVDTSESEWYNEYIVWAVKNGITNGTDDTHFSPEEFITREDMCVMITRYMSLKGINTDAVSDNDTVFTDDSEISEYAKLSVYQLKAMEIVNGLEDNSFAPKNNATRAETAKLISLSFFED